MAVTLNLGEVPDGFENLCEYFGLVVEECTYAQHPAFNFREFEGSLDPRLKISALAVGRGRRGGKLRKKASHVWCLHHVQSESIPL